LVYAALPPDERIKSPSVKLSHYLDQDREEGDQSDLQRREDRRQLRQCPLICGEDFRQCGQKFEEGVILELPVKSFTLHLCSSCRLHLEAESIVAKY